MRTEDLVAQLAADPRPIRSGAVERGLAVALLGGGTLSLLILFVWLGLRPLEQAVTDTSFWMKATFTLAAAISGWILTHGLARPAGKIGAASYLALAPLGLLAVAGVGQVAATPTLDPGLILGSTWSKCPFRVLALSTPIFLTLIVSLRRGAPTRMRMTGAAAGLLAGGVGATIYGLYCSETSAAFVAIWYTFGIGLCALMGAVVGPRLLRW